MIILFYPKKKKKKEREREREKEKEKKRNVSHIWTQYRASNIKFKAIIIFLFYQNKERNRKDRKRESKKIKTVAFYSLSVVLSFCPAEEDSRQVVESYCFF